MIWTAATSVLVPVLAVTHAWINLRQASPYMDELFHIPQATAFCKAVHSWQVPAYSPHITTPPGLYLLPAVLSPIFGCGVRVLRGFTSAAVLVILLLLAGVAYELCGDSAQAWRVALTLSTHPPLLFSAALFYTDAPCVALLALCWLLALRARPWLAALAGIGAVMTRQSSAVWHAFFVMHAILQSMRSGGPRLGIFHQIFPHLLAILLYAVLFAANGNSLAVGERDSHSVMLHTAQLPFFAAYQAIFASLALLPTVPIALRSAMQAPRTAIAAIILAFSVATVCIIHTGSYVHPYSLADNRHYVFYIYRRVLLLGPLVRYALIPLYTVALLLPFVPPSVRGQRNVANEKRTNKASSLLAWLLRGIHNDDALEPLLQLVVLGVVAISVIPSSLLELRYFIPGFLVSMMFFLTRRNFRFGNVECAVLCTVNLAIHVAFIFVFAERPFKRALDAHMPHDYSPGRFML